jgi:hypothetical protein
VIRAPRSCQEILLEQMSDGALARMRSDLGIGALAPRRAAASGWRQPGSLAHSCRRGDNHGMARDDDSADRLLRRLVLMSLLDGARSSGTLEWVSPVTPVFYPGRRRGRALGLRPPAAGPGRVGKRCWLRAGGVGPWHRSTDPGRGAKEHRAAKGPVARAWHRGAGYPPGRKHPRPVSDRGTPLPAGGVPPLRIPHTPVISPQPADVTTQTLRVQPEIESCQ